MSQEFVQTDTILDTILAHKLNEIEQLKAMFDAKTVMRKSSEMAYQPRDFIRALRKETVALVAEVKKASPSKGILREDFDPLQIGTTYANNGASAISVLTDKKFFQGELSYLGQVRNAVDVPVLRKDFIIDSFQIHYMRATQISADAVLLIVACLSDSQLQHLYDEITDFGMTPLVEIHNEEELDRALAIDAKLIGINNRNLNTFEVDLQTTARLAEHIPNDVTVVAESGIRNVEDVSKMGQLGAHAVLVGESLVRSDDMAQSVHEFSSQVRHVEC